MRVADGYILKCDRKITGLPLKINNFDFKANFYVVNMGDTDLVLGMTWLHDIGEFTLNLRDMEMKFQSEGKTHILKVIRDSGFRMMSCRRMESLLRHDQVEWAARCTLMPSQGQQKSEYHPNIQELRIKYCKVFQ